MNRRGMTQDALIISARKAEEEADQLEDDLGREGIIVDPLSVLAARAEAFYRTMLDDEGWAMLELEYQERRLRGLQANAEAARSAAARSKLAMPAGVPNDHLGPGGRRRG